MEVFLTGLWESLDVIGRMALLVIAGYVMVRRGWLRRETLTDLTRLLIDLVIPATFILAMTRSFSPDLLEQAGVLALVSLGWILLSWLVGTGLYRALPGESRSRDRSVTAMMMISNSLYLPLPVILAVAPESLGDRAVVYISIISLPSMVIMWTLGVRLLAGKGGGEVDGSGGGRILNAPIVSLAAGILLSLIPGVRETARGEPGGFAPLGTLFSGMELVSALLSPLAMMILGGLIASGRGGGRVPLRYLVPLAAVRLLLIPAGVYLLIRSGLTGVSGLAATVLLLVAAAPPATNHALIARRYGGEWELVARLQLLLHLLALVTLPLWLSAGLAFMGG